MKRTDYEQIKRQYTSRTAKLLALDGANTGAQTAICAQIEQVLQPLRENSLWGPRNTFSTVQAIMGPAEGLRVTTHEALHQGVNFIRGVPSRMGVFIEDKTGLPQAFTVPDFSKANGVPQLATRLQKTQPIHEWVDKHLWGEKRLLR